MVGFVYEWVMVILLQVLSGKLFYIVDEGEVVIDFIFICVYIECVYGVDFDVGLDVCQCVECWVIECMFEDYFYFVMVWFCWIDLINFVKGLV